MPKSESSTLTVDAVATFRLADPRTTVQLTGTGGRPVDFELLADLAHCEEAVVRGDYDPSDAGVEESGDGGLEDVEGRVE